MTISRHLNSRSAAFLLMLLTVWLIFAPVQLGGQAAYIIVNGNSMEPLYKRGDLVILRAASSYQIGDIVTYQHPDIGPVIHRIIGRAGERWIFKGDHNDFIDPYQPAQTDLIGKAWIHLPSAGGLLTQLRTPAAMAMLAIGAGGVILGTATQRAVRRRGHSSRKAAQQPAAHQSSSLREGVFSGLALLGLASLALAVVAFTRPLWRAVPDTITYQHSGTFSYAAAAPPGIYDSPTVQPGEPVFRQVISSLTADFTYRFVSNQASDLHGTYHLLARLSASDGWQRTIELQPLQPFDGTTFAARGRLDLAQVQALIDQLEQRAGIRYQQHTLAIVPEVHLEGTLAGQALQDTFSPRLEFQLDAEKLQLVKGDDSKNPLQPVQEGQIKHDRREPNTLALLGLQLPVTVARWIALSGLGASLAGIGVLSLYVRKAARGDEAAAIRLKYGAQIIDATANNPPWHGPALQLASIADLARLAERIGMLILHETSGDIHRFTVRDGNVCYYYQVQRPARQAGPTPRPASPTHTSPVPITPVAPQVNDPASPPPGSVSPQEAEPATGWQAVFLAELYRQGLVSAASRAAGVPMAAAYQERAINPSFARAWDRVRTGHNRQLPKEAP